MRVLHLVKTSVGAAWALRQMRELVKLGIDVHVALPFRDPSFPCGGPMVEKYRMAGVTVHDLQTDFPIRNPHRFPALAREFRHLVDQIHPDIIHSHFVGTTLTMRLALGKTATPLRIFQVPGPLHLEHPFFRAAEILTAGPSDVWIGSCQWTCQRYQQSGIDPDRLFLSYYGTDIDRTVPQRTGKLRQELGLSATTNIVGMVAYCYGPKWYVGQTRGLKGHEDLIDALAVCLENKANLVGVFVGGAWAGADAYAAKVQAYGREKLGNRAIFLGSRSDVAELYPDFDVAVHPSHSENVGGAAESLMLGVPTIATEVGGFPDLVIPGKTGWLVPPKNPGRLAATILEVLDNPDEAQRRALQGQDLARELLSIDNTAPQIADIYWDLIRGRAETRAEGWGLKKQGLRAWG
ncbi:MAG TPA: glycosyltransferase family 4 protein [Acidobacteriota bacterium]|nr:glycosyltransferase family 4 protein [Acidobacteriota bacterium]